MEADLEHLKERQWTNEEASFLWFASLVHFFKISKILQKDQSVLFDHFDISKFWQEITSRNLALMVL